MTAPTFLTLPAEIRNMIYIYAAHNAKIVLKKPRQCCSDRADRTKYVRISDAIKFFGLTQVCRQVRKEFQPMYMAEAKFFRQVQGSPYLSTKAGPLGFAAAICTTCEVVELPLSSIKLE